MILDSITPSETLQLHELLTMKSLSLTKSVAMLPLVGDEELKNILNSDSINCEGHIRQLRGFLEKSDLLRYRPSNPVSEIRKNSL
jgi:similar to spore coat protein